MAQNDMFTTDPSHTWRPTAATCLESTQMAQLAPSPRALPRALPCPPQNLEAEESVLGAMMLSPGAIAPSSEILDAGDFYRESHAKIYRAALALYSEASRSTRSRSPTSSSSAASSRTSAAASASTSSRPSSPRPRTLATTRGSSTRWRRCAGSIRAGGEISRLGWERPGETPDLVDRAEQLVFDLVAEPGHERASSDIESLLKESFERITRSTSPAST